MPELDLAWPEVAGCPGEDELLRRIEAQLGRALDDVPSALRVRVRIDRTDAGYTLTLATEHGGTRGERRFSARSCEEVSEAAVLVITLSIGEAESAREARATRDDERERPPSSPVASPASARERPPKRSRVALRGSALLEGGYAPSLGYGPELALAVGIGASHVELAGMYLTPQRSPARYDGTAVEVSLWAARAGYCRDLAGQRNRLGLCAGFEVGRAKGRGIALRESVTRSFLWTAGWLSLRLTTQLHRRLALILEPALAVPLTPHRFVSTTPSQERSAILHTPRPTSKRVTFGAAIFF